MLQLLPKGERSEEEKAATHCLSPLSQLPDLLLPVKLDHPEPPQQIQTILLIGIRGWQYHVKLRQSLGGGGIRSHETRPLREL